jgi:hypothetical protein
VVNSSTPSKNFDVCQIPDPDPSGNGYYAVYTEMKRGSANFCGWHIKSACNGISVQIAFFFKLDGDTSCGEWDASTTAQDKRPQTSVGVAVLAAHRVVWIGVGWGGIVEVFLRLTDGQGSDEDISKRAYMCCVFNNKAPYIHTYIHPYIERR